MEKTHSWFIDTRPARHANEKVVVVIKPIEESSPNKTKYTLEECKCAEFLIPEIAGYLTTDELSTLRPRVDQLTKQIYDLW